MSQSGAKRDNSQYRVRLPKSVRFPIADALKHEASANTISHRDKIVAVAVRCALRQASVAKMSPPRSAGSPHGFHLTHELAVASRRAPNADDPTRGLVRSPSTAISGSPSDGRHLEPQRPSGLQIPERRSFISGSFSARPTNTPMRRISSGCCARAASGHAAAAPPSSVMNSRRSHSITSSARASSVGGGDRSSALVVFRLMISSNLIGCSTGRSAGFAPLKILSTHVAARRNKSRKSTP